MNDCMIHLDRIKTLCQWYVSYKSSSKYGQNCNWTTYFTVVFILYGSSDEGNPVSTFLPQSSQFDFLPVLSSLSFLQQNREWHWCFCSWVVPSWGCEHVASYSEVHAASIIRVEMFRLVSFCVCITFCLEKNWGKWRGWSGDWCLVCTSRGSLPENFCHEILKSVRKLFSFPVVYRNKQPFANYFQPSCLCNRKQKVVIVFAVRVFLPLCYFM